MLCCTTTTHLPYPNHTFPDRTGPDTPLPNLIPLPFLVGSGLLPYFPCLLVLVCGFIPMPGRIPCIAWDPFTFLLCHYPCHPTHPFVRAFPCLVPPPYLVCNPMCNLNFYYTHTFPGTDGSKPLPYLPFTMPYMVPPPPQPLLHAVLYLTITMPLHSLCPWRAVRSLGPLPAYHLAFATTRMPLPTHPDTTPTCLACPAPTLPCPFHAPTLPVWRIVLTLPAAFVYALCNPMPASGPLVCLHTQEHACLPAPTWTPACRPCCRRTLHPHPTPALLHLDYPTPLPLPRLPPFALPVGD